MTIMPFGRCERIIDYFEYAAPTAAEIVAYWPMPFRIGPKIWKPQYPASRGENGRYFFRLRQHILL